MCRYRVGYADRAGNTHDVGAFAFLVDAQGFADVVRAHYRVHRPSGVSVFVWDVEDPERGDISDADVPEAEAGLGLGLA